MENKKSRHDHDSYKIGAGAVQSYSHAENTGLVKIPCLTLQRYIQKNKLPNFFSFFYKYFMYRQFNKKHRMGVHCICLLKKNFRNLTKTLHYSRLSTKLEPEKDCFDGR